MKQGLPGCASWGRPRGSRDAGRPPSWWISTLPASQHSSDATLIRGCDPAVLISYFSITHPVPPHPAPSASRLAVACLSPKSRSFPLSGACLGAGQGTPRGLWCPQSPAWPGGAGDGEHAPVSERGAAAVSSAQPCCQARACPGPHCFN